MQESFDTITEDARTKVPLRRLVERHLTQVRSGVGVRRDQHVGIGVEEDADRQVPLIQQDLSSCLMLPIEKSDLSASVFGWIYPGERNVKLWTFAVEFFKQTPDRVSDRARIYF